jgi:hypothetical protein
MTDIIGYAASCAVLATFLMRTMVPLRMIGILSNVLFLTYGYLQHLYPVFFLHLALLPINLWRLRAAAARLEASSGLEPSGRATSWALAAAFRFAGGALFGAVGLMAAVLVASRTEPALLSEATSYLSKPPTASGASSASLPNKNVPSASQRKAGGTPRLIPIAAAADLYAPQSGGVLRTAAPRSPQHSSHPPIKP